jgi:iron complex transport system substrate-binding protein
MRIVSLIASSTEIVCALGFEHNLVGRSHECDYPPGVVRLPVCTEPKFDVEGSSRAIDERVKALLQDATSVYRVRIDVLQQLLPDVIITQSQCEVCAVSLRNVEAAACALLPSRPRIVSLEPNALADLFTDIDRVATALGAPERGEALTAELRAEIDRISCRAHALPDRPRVACIEWTDPLMAAGNWMPELVELAGGTNVVGEAGRHSPWLSWETLLGADPDVVIFLPCGYDLARTRREVAALQRAPEWSRLRAARAGRAYLTDGNQFFNRPGPRLVDSLAILTELIHPAHFLPVHRGSAWQAIEPH